MKNENLTVIIPYYNNPNNQIKKAIESVIKQKKIDIKILLLIIDDNSKKKIDLDKLNLPKYDKKKIKIKIFKKKKNQGDSSSRVTGVKISKSKYIAFLDADDYWLSLKLYYQFSFLKKYKKKIIGTDWNNKSHFISFFNLSPDYYKINKILMSLKWWPHLSTILMERNLFISLKLYTSKRYRFAGDGDMLIKLASLNSFIVVKKNLVKCHSFKINPYISGMSAKMSKMKNGEIQIIKDNFKNKIFIFFVSLLINFKYLIRLMKFNLR